MKKIYVFLTLVLMLSGQVALAQYRPISEIPGTAGLDAIDTFPEYVIAVYKFAIWAVGISSLFMISIGGFMYFTSAGNTSKMESGKRVIMDAIYGLFAVLFAWLILNTINEQLVNISITNVGRITR
jgi:hypothetical protein